jgi:Papain family cysteine protease
MPIRMVDDPNDQQQENYDDNSGGGGGGGFSGGGILNFLPLILGLFRNKFGLLVLLAAGVFFVFKGGCLKGVMDKASQFAQGGTLDPKQYAKASVYEGLEDDNSKNPLPESVSLLSFAPNRLNQGQQGSCVAWSSAYAAHTILESASTRQDPNQLKFSPSYMYNQIGLDGCQGSYIIRAMELMTKKGSVPFEQFPYDESNCSRNPGSSLDREASQYKIHGFSRLSDGDNTSKLSIRAVKEHLAKDAPVVIGMMVGQSFMQPMMGQELWTPAANDRSMLGMGGHAMCVIGYDDRKFGGAFEIMNSWGPEWGKNGIGWVRYGDFKTYVREAYGIDPLPKRGAAANIPLECNIGLVSDKKYIPLRVKSGNVFETQSPLKKGTKFKIEVKNATECYIYVFGQETDASSYVLFPYTAKHSPYCGITGVRLFPKGSAMAPDSIGNRDYMAVIVSKTPLEYAKINQAISQAPGSTYADKVNAAVQSIAIRSARFSAGNNGTIYFKVSSNDNNVVASVVEIDKN